jgi:hypothetical protein
VTQDEIIIVEAFEASYDVAARRLLLRLHPSSEHFGFGRWTSEPTFAIS